MKFPGFMGVVALRSIFCATLYCVRDSDHGANGTCNQLQRCAIIFCYDGIFKDRQKSIFQTQLMDHVLSYVYNEFRDKIEGSSFSVIIWRAKINHCGYVHFPHKKAVKHFFPVATRPRRQNYTTMQKRKRQ